MFEVSAKVCFCDVCVCVKSAFLMCVCLRPRDLAVSSAARTLITKSFLNFLSSLFPLAAG